MTERQRLYLAHIVECLDRIDDYLPDTKAQFLDDTMRQDALIRTLQVLAESTKRLSDDVKDSRPEVDWAAIAGFRNVLVHEYLGVDLDEVWKVATRDLSQLRTTVQDALKVMGSVAE
jgi:uncharacterized protein with HEPN domain